LRRSFYDGVRWLRRSFYDGVRWLRRSFYDRLETTTEDMRVPRVEDPGHSSADLRRTTQGR
jgi:hypothetical protein